MKRRNACAVLCTFSILASVTCSTAVMAEENAQTEIQTEAAAAEQTETVSEQADETEAETEAVSEQTEESDMDAIKIDRDHPEGRIGVAYDQPNAWDELAMTNDKVVDTGINIRATADPEGEVLGYLYKGCAAWILNRGDEWTEIYSGGMTGFVKSEYLVFGDEARALAQIYGTDGITAMWEGVAVFAEPDGESEVVKVLRTGDDMFLISDESDWLKVKLDEENTAYVFEGDIIRSLVLDSAVPKDGVYKDVEPAAEVQEEEVYEEPYEENYDDSSDGETYVEDYSQPQTSAPETNPPQTSAPETNPPQTSAPETDPPQTSAPETDPPQTSAPETDPPQTSAPETDPPQTSAPETDPPQTSAAETDAPVIDDGDDSSIEGDEGWYDADTDTYYDANGNVIQQSADSQYTDEYAEYEADEEEVYYEEEADAEEYVEETYTEAAYTEETEAYVEETEAYYAEETYVEESYAEETYAEETEASAASVDDTSLLAALIYCEAGNQSYEGMVAVGAVVMNRVNSSSFPGSISEVIYQSGQFTPASSGSLSSALANGVPSSCYEAASAAIAGENPVGGALYFNTGSGSGIQIGDHQFY